MPRTRVVAFRSSASSKGTGCRGSTRRGMPSATASSQSSVRESERPRDDVGATNAPPNTKTAEERFVLSLASCSASVLEGSFSGMAATRSSNTRLAQRAGLSLKAHTLCMQVYAQAHQTPDATEDSEENRDSVVVPTTLPQIIKARPSQHCIQAFGLPHQGCVSMLAAAKPGIKSGSASGRVKSVQPREMIASALFVGLPLLGGALSGAASKESVEGWYKTLKKPSWTPPDAFFPIVWSSLYVAMGVAASLVRTRTDGRCGVAVWALTSLRLVSLNAHSHWASPSLTRFFETELT